MKFKSIVALLAFPLCAVSQSNNHFTLSISNNGQTNKTLEDFYFFAASGFNPNDNVSNYSQNEFKFNVQYEHLINDHILLGLAYGHWTRSDQYAPLDIPNGFGEKNLTSHTIEGTCLYYYDFDKIAFSVGATIPFFLFEEYSDAYEQRDSAMIFNSIYSIDGGTAYGINFKTSILFFVSKHLYLSTSFQFGYLRYNLGDETVYAEHETTATSSENTYFATYETKYKKNTITPPEYSIGIGYRF